MTTETKDIAVRDDAPIAVQYNPTMPSMDELKVITTMANHFHKLAGKMIPSSVKSSEEAFAIMVAGREFGLGPFESFREMHVINGTTMPGYRVLMGIVMRGDPTASFKWLERSATRCCVQLKRAGLDTLEVEYTIEDAKRAGLTGKDNWQKHPTDMLAAKAVTRACRLGGPDLITAIGQSVRGAPAVMRAVEDAIDDDGDDIPELEATVAQPPSRSPQEVREAQQPRPQEPAPAPTGRAALISAVGADIDAARQSWDKPSFSEWTVRIKADFPTLIDARGAVRFAGLDDETLAAVAKRVHGDVYPAPDGEQGEQETMRI